MGRNWHRLSYVLAGTALAGLLLVAWLNRDRFRPINVGTPAPDFRAFDRQGRPVGLADYDARVLLVNIWATWCLPCREEMPSLQRLYEQMKDQGLEIVAVSVDARVGETDALGHSGSDIRAYADTLGLTFEIVHDPTGRIQETYRTTGVPESFVIGPDRVIYKKVIGPTQWDAPEHQALIRRLLAGS